MIAPDFPRLYSRFFVLGSHWSEFLTSAAVSAGPGDVVLDAGSGESPHAHLFRHCRRYVAVDLRQPSAHSGGTCGSIRADISSLPLADRAIDVIFCTQALEHTRDPGRVLSEFQRVLKPGGRLFLSAPLVWPEHLQPMDYFRFTQFGLRNLLADAGFDSVQLQSMGGFYSVCRFMWDELWNDRRLFRHRYVAWPTAPVRWILRAVGRWVFAPACVVLDRSDVERELTLGYFCTARKISL